MLDLMDDLLRMISDYILKLKTSHQKNSSFFADRRFHLASDLNTAGGCGIVSVRKGLEMKILISGAGGFIGSAVTAALVRRGDEVLRLIRQGRLAHRGQIVWNPSEGFIQHQHLDRLDAVIHLAGEPILGRWTAVKRQQIRDSRLVSTQFLARTLANLNPRPKVFLCASAAGYYGHRGEEILTEQSSSGEGFLAEVCRDWEAACDPARRAGIRTVHLRLGMVLGKNGGALGQMLPMFRLGLGGPLGSGQQWMSWISIEDAVGAMLFCLGNDSVCGAVNLTAPEPVRNRDFAKILAHAVHRPAVLSVPRLALRMKFGELADEVLLSSARVLPEKLTAAGFSFRHRTLEVALASVL
jgi:uncharacterized protein (TIGR01777 family)